MKKILVVITLLMAVLLTSCSAKYDLDAMKINKEDHPGWHEKIRTGYKVVEDYRFIEVSYGGYGRSKTEMDQKLEYRIFESTSDAKGYYKKWKDYCYRGSEGEKNSGVNWFVSREPDTYDMIAYRMYYREDNVIICADVSLTYYSTENGGTSSTAVSESEGDQIRKYILDNHKKLKENVMKMFKE
ncbi:MAG: hypothetical protein J6W65_05920 [Oscillospiraceae bacterium]|nr:hypothetical protein [Oscillospiraceae bacterium]